MSEASKPTPGPWFEHREGFSTVYVEARIGGGMVQEVAACGPTDAGQYQQAANARLIAEAGTVHHETGLTPRQLVDRMKAVESAMRDAREMIEADHVDAAYQMLGEAITNLVKREKQ
ncbi:hypothetical protein [Delftia acidovorans]|uniref:hypothetical protein n=1 Tax=Delftia acidovorans TaxID=80866 RepID=UPI002FDE3674